MSIDGRPYVHFVTKDGRGIEARDPAPNAPDAVPGTIERIRYDKRVPSVVDAERTIRWDRLIAIPAVLAVPCAFLFRWFYRRSQL